MTTHPSLHDVRSARDRIAGRVRTTPVVPAPFPFDPGPVLLKLENEQETGSFKLRGATNKILSLDEAERNRGVVAVSTGNHGRAVAKVAADLGIAATICISSRVPEVKVAAMRDLGAHLLVAGPTQDDADAAARDLAEQGLTFVHPFDDPFVIAGQGTAGLEILEQVPEVRTVVVPLSGGGLISGIAAAVKGTDPGIAVIGISQDRGPAMYESLRAGHLVDVVEEDTLADSLAGGLGPENHHTFAMCRDLLDETLLVSETEIAAAMATLYRDGGMSVEGGGTVGVAALLAGRLRPEPPIVVVISGGNIAADKLQAIVEAS